MSVNKEIKRITTHVLQAMKLRGEKISMLTAYDYSLARIVDEAGIDIILVGDSASNVMAGHETTLPITLDQMIARRIGSDTPLPSLAIPDGGTGTVMAAHGSWASTPFQTMHAAP